MRSPVESKKQMESVQLEDGLMAYRCPESGGHYIPATCYMRWLARQPARKPQLPPADDEQPVMQSDSAAYLCPETGTVMTRYKVGHGFRFSIDRSITGGVWLDAGEWEALRKRNFHDELHFIFTDPWQRRVRQTEVSTNRRKRLEERVGKDLLDRIDGLKSELESHPNREEIVAYIMNK